MERLLREIQGMDRNANLDGDTLRKYIERYGKEVAKNVRHRACEIINEQMGASVEAFLFENAVHEIMNIRFDEVKPG